MIIYTDRHIISLTPGTCKQCGEELEAVEYVPAIGLQDVLDLLRTGTAPDVFGLTQEDWAIYKCNKAAGKLQGMIEQSTPPTDYTSMEHANITGDHAAKITS